MIGVIILNYNTYQDTLNLVCELQEQSVASRLRVVVVDNCSPNESYEKLKPLEQRYSNVVVIATSENLGYAKGNNWGLKYLEESSATKYVAILNSDVSIERDCFERLAKRYEQLDNAGVVAPIMVDERGVHQIVMGKLPTLWDDFK